MENTIFEKIRFQKTENCPEQYNSLVEAVLQNHGMELMGMYEQEEHPGFFVHIKLFVSIPTGGIYGGLDIHPDEEIIIYARADYPYSAPAVLFVRNDFPTAKIPHLNCGVSGSSLNMLNPCLYRGDIDEWFFENGAAVFCDRVNDWFSDLVNGELIHDDGFETIRLENAAGYIELDEDSLVEMIQKYDRSYGDIVLQMQGYPERHYYRVINAEYQKQLKPEILPCILVFDRTQVVSDYISKPFNTEQDLKEFPCEKRISHGLRKVRGKYYEADKIEQMKEILVVIAVKRPMQVIGSFSEYEFIAVVMAYNFKTQPVIEKCPIQNLLVIRKLNTSMAERLSGTEHIIKHPIIMFGCGALGSKISMLLARMGYDRQYLYDNDVLLPHNLVRHYENSSYLVGLSKAFIATTEIDCMYKTCDVAVANIENIFHKEGFPDGLIVDCTASKRSLLWSVTSSAVSAPIFRSEIYHGGKMGLTLHEGENRNPDVLDMYVQLYDKALTDDLIFEWLTYKEPENMQFHIGVGCSSDTMILDDATVCNHASIVPHLVNQYQDSEEGIACINIFDRDHLTNNKTVIYPLEAMDMWEISDGWSVHICRSLCRKIQNISEEKTENAGLWIGYIEERIRRIILVDTYIPDDNIRKPANVMMGEHGVKSYVENVSQRSGNLLGYIGEWHTHTSGDASPSRKDKDTFRDTKPNTSVFLMTICSPQNIRHYCLKGGRA